MCRAVRCATEGDRSWQFVCFFAVLLGVWAVEAHAGSMDVKNCSGMKIRVQSYNSMDTIYFASFANVDIDHRTQASIACGTDTCKLKVYYGDTTNTMWMNYAYSWGVCAQGPWNAELERIERCAC